VILLRANSFHTDKHPDYAVVWKEADGRERKVGRISHDPNGIAWGGLQWFWGVDFQQWQGRPQPYSGRAADLKEAEMKWRRCWDSADVPIRW
jgi:hypothetical protein